MAIGQTFAAYTNSGRAGNATGEAALSVRRFGTWTFLAGIIRLYAAYKIDCSELYLLAMWTYGIVVTHYTVEWVVFGIHDSGRKGALLVSICSLCWMIAQSNSFGNAS